MTLAAGTRLGPYEILAPLGAGGMGEVYRAKDTRLGREVAVKVLPERLAEDADALARFEREAKAVAALSHPNILALHDFGREGNVAYAVSELLDGETLGAAIAGHPLPPRQAARYGGQIALGLAAAHEKGIVHRDLKPDNVFVTRDEHVKILDFGLARMDAGAKNPAEATQSPTVTDFTEPGKVMGTVGYMSPEQVRGLPLDHRSDIFSFGTVLFEMLTGGRAFLRQTAAETMTAILKEEPAVSARLLSGEAASLVPVLRHCLEKKPERRYQSARDLAYALETASTATGAAAAVPEPPKKRGAAVRWLGALALAAAAAIAAYVLRGARAEPSVPELGDATLFSLTTDPGYEGEPTFSPDGKTIAYVADRDGNFEIYLQQIAGGPALNLTQNSAADIQPSFSPDGREIAFVSNRSPGSEIMHAAPNLPLAGGDIWVMPTLGGPARRIVEEGNCPSWTPDGQDLLYVHGTFRSPRMSRVAASGGASRDIPIEEANPARYFFPSLSEDGLWLLYQNGDQIQVVPSAGGKSKVLARGQAPSWGAESKSILFTTAAAGKGRSLWTAPFSAAKGELSGPARPLTFGSGIDAGGKSSRDGTVIAYSAIEETLNLEALPFDAEKGRATGAPRILTSGNNHISFFDPSPDGKAVAFAAGSGRRSHLWRIEGTAPAVELTRDPAYADNWPEWSPDGREIAFARSGVGDSLATTTLWIMKADGTQPRRVTDFVGQMAWLPDGSIVFQSGENLVRRDLATGVSRTIAGAKVLTMAAVDNAGRWLAFQTGAGNSMVLEAVEIDGGTPRRIATGTPEAFHPFFSPSGRWLYFQPSHGNLYRVPGPAQGWATAPPEKVTNFSGLDLYIENPRISQDGSTLVYTRGKRTGDIVILHPAQKREKR